MPEVSSESFRTKTGRCIVSADRIVIRRERIRGQFSNLILGQSIWRIRIIYGVMSLLTLVVAAFYWKDGNVLATILFGALGAFIAVSVLRSRKYSAASEIATDCIECIDPHPPRTGVTRAYFIVHFCEHGADQKRIIMLPSSVDDREFQDAIRIFQKFNLMD